MTKARLLRELQGLGIAWCILCAVGATIGGIAGWRSSWRAQ